jgi:tetratricopeptide (TPR) repeat protein
MFCRGKTPSVPMKNTFRIACACMLILGGLMAPPSLVATCGGGGGGGKGGAVPDMRGGGGDAPEVYRVSWHLAGPGQKLPAESSLMMLWFPPSATVARMSTIHFSRGLAQAGARCVKSVLVPMDNTELRTLYKVSAGQQAVVLTDGTGAEINRVEVKHPIKLEVDAVEQMLEDEIAVREKAAGDTIKTAEKKAKAGDATAVPELQQVWAQRCLFPGLGRKAAKTLLKFGVRVSQADLEHLGSDQLADATLSGRDSLVPGLLQQGLAAELKGDYRIAEGYYRQASELDPTDATALRFLGELYRHQTGEWDKAGKIFNRILMQPADPIARAVALHGLGKMTIHAGRYKAGLALFEQSIATYPLPITYRNLAVYWFSEKQEEKAAGYMRQALALDPDDTYNQIFAAVYLAAAGHKDEALKIAQANEPVMEASYNLAAIWAQTGDKAKAMELLRRQFYGYERYAAVRSMEMKEARDDYMFASLHNNTDFIELTKQAKSAYLIGVEWCSPEALGEQPTYEKPMPGAGG